MAKKRRKSREICGFTEILFFNDDSIEVSHCGNMGNTKKDVMKNIKIIFDKNKYDFNQYVLESETGSPDYLYTANYTKVKS